MLVRRIAVAPTVGREAVVWGAEVGGRDDDRRPRNAPAEILDAPQLEARAADLSPLEQRLAQPHRGHPVPALHQVSVPARAAHHVPRVGRRVVGSPSRSPFGEERRR
ncbi:hypothetical protein TorRG33x02_064030 [Trema orientale]|uniref:Uncharacterized protein n=1 Tax=Trema orientale TaxID=63057 RepID=A0A2P5FJ66_TREOI|nr:hypothetical protein TorRG33x02_064030 [Trema orientale]